MVWPRVWFPNELQVLSASLLLPRLRMLRFQGFVEYLALFAVVPHRMTCLYKNKTSYKTKRAADSVRSQRQNESTHTKRQSL